MYTDFVDPTMWYRTRPTEPEPVVGSTLIQSMSIIFTLASLMFAVLSVNGLRREPEVNASNWPLWLLTFAYAAAAVYVKISSERRKNQNQCFNPATLSSSQRSDSCQDVTCRQTPREPF